MDTGWKSKTYWIQWGAKCVSILIIMDTGWKGGNPFKYLFFRM